MGRGSGVNAESETEEETRHRGFFCAALRMVIHTGRRVRFVFGRGEHYRTIVASAVISLLMIFVRKVWDCLRTYVLCIAFHFKQVFLVRMDVRATLPVETAEL